MRHFVYVLVAILVYLIIGKIAEVAYFSVFPYNFETVPGDMLMEDFEMGLFRRQICIHLVIAIVYVLLLCEKIDWLIYSVAAVGYCFFNDVNTPLAIASNIACVAPMIAASWVRATKVNTQEKRKQAQASKQSVSVADELKKLNELRQQNVISDAEFEAQKRRLLNS